MVSFVRAPILALLVTFSAIASVAGTVSASELKGLELGMSEAAARAQIGEGAKCSPPPKPTHRADMMCMADSTFGGVPSTAFVIIKGDSVQSVVFRFDSGAYETVTAGLIQKFGPASEVTERTLQNRMGATFQASRAIWQLPDGRLTADERAGSVDRGAVTLIATSALEHEPDGKSAAQDM